MIRGMLFTEKGSDTCFLIAFRISKLLELKNLGP